MFSRWLVDYGFTNIDGDGVTYVKTQLDEKGFESKILMSIHVDDGIAASNNERMYKEFIAAMSKDFDLSDSGELKWFLGCKVEQDKACRQLTLHHSTSAILKSYATINSSLGHACISPLLRVVTAVWL
jgi:hypothetical protein